MTLLGEKDKERTDIALKKLIKNIDQKNTNFYNVPIIVIYDLKM